MSRYLSTSTISSIGYCKVCVIWQMSSLQRPGFMQSMGFQSEYNEISIRSFFPSDMSYLSSTGNSGRAQWRVRFLKSHYTAPIDPGYTVLDYDVYSRLIRSIITKKLKLNERNKLVRNISFSRSSRPAIPSLFCVGQG